MVEPKGDLKIGDIVRIKPPFKGTWEFEGVHIPIGTIFEIIGINEHNNGVCWCPQFNVTFGNLISMRSGGWERFFEKISK